VLDFPARKLQPYPREPRVEVFRMAYRCSVCGESHESLPDIGSDRPYYWHTLPPEERGRRAWLTEDTCVIDDEDFFIRGVLLIPVHDYGRDFGFGVWVSQKMENFRRYLAEPDSDRIGPFFGWLSTEISYYPESTLGLKTTAHFRGGGARPTVELEPTEHPLAVDQREGITLAKAWEIVHFYTKDGDARG
jgi:hypothetical protein